MGEGAGRLLRAWHGEIRPRSSPVLPLIGGGTTKFQPVFVGDMTAGLLEVLRRSEAAVEDLNDLSQLDSLN